MHPIKPYSEKCEIILFGNFKIKMYNKYRDRTGRNIKNGPLIALYKC